jgi:uncharacterized protein YbjT (DUF2867 family)
MAILVTGATGFLGDHLTKRLLAEGNHVRVLARSPDRAKPLIEAGAELAAGDITDVYSVSAALQNAAIQTAAQAQEAGLSRIWAGIHYQIDNASGVQLGRSVVKKFIDWANADGSQ